MQRVHAEDGGTVPGRSVPVRHGADANALRFLIGRELRDARERAQKSQREAAAVLHCTQTKINYLESGRNQQQPEQITALFEFYGQFTQIDEAQVQRLSALAARADRTNTPYRDVVPDWLRTFVGLESLASTIFTYRHSVFPEQLQTPAYAAALLQGHLQVAPMDVPRVVTARMARQRVDATNPLRLRAVIDEAVLDRAVGGPSVLLAQLEHVVQVMHHDTVQLRVLPLAHAVHDGLAGEFMLLDFDHARSIGYVEYFAGAVYVQQPDQLALYTMAAQRLWSAGLSAAESAALLIDRIQALRPARVVD